MVGEREGVEPRGCGARHYLGRRPRAVRGRTVAVQIGAGYHHLADFSRFPPAAAATARRKADRVPGRDRKSTRLNSSHITISYAVFCLKKKKQQKKNSTSPKNRKQI